MITVCGICPHRCKLDENQTGFCRARSNRGGAIVSINYALLTSIALDPIEKKPLYRFYPGSKILSVGSFGCNFRCPFCQNHEISMTGEGRMPVRHVVPEELVRIAVELIPKGNIGIAFTYNEPLIGYEYVLECAKHATEAGLKIVLVTNGYINEEPFLELLPYVHALNIDLKAYNEDFYHRIGGGLEQVKHSIELAAGRSHVEVTTLIIPGENDSEEELRSLSRWLSDVSPDIPLHLTRFFPRYRMKDKAATGVERIYFLAETAREYLKYVYEGNC